MAVEFPLVSFNNLPLSNHQVAQFVAFLHRQGLAPATLLSYTSAIGYVHRLCGFPDPSKATMVQKLIAGAVKLSPKSDPRLPITYLMVGRLVQALEFTTENSYQRVLMKAMILIGFFGLMRIGELTSSKHKVVALNLDQVTFSPGLLTIKIVHFKHNQSLKPVDIPIRRQAALDICPVLALHHFIQVRGLGAGPLFCFHGAKVVPRDFFILHLKRALVFCGFLADRYQSHSLRIGGASYLAELGYSDSQIRLLGRWSSNAFIKYIRSYRALYK